MSEHILRRIDPADAGAPAASYPLPEGGALTLGSAASCSIRVEGAGVAPVHLRLARKGGRAAVAGASPEIEWRVNGRRVAKHLLAPGDVLHLGAGADAVALRYEARAAAAAVTAAAADPLVGSRLGGYRIDRRIGQGAAGTVYAATQLSLQRTVALKVFRIDAARDRAFVDKLLSEAQAIARLDHPNVVHVHDAGQEGDYCFYSMEYVPGGTLADFLAREGPLEGAAALGVALEVARALAWAEGIGIIHRDIKPANLLVTATGGVKLSDLGVAIEKDAAAGGDRRWVGSPRFLAPEQALGRPIDHRADIYALGCTLYYATSGVHVFDGDTPAAILRAKTTLDPTPVAAVRPGLDPAAAAIIDRMVAREPEARFATCADLVAAIEAAIAGPAAAAGPAEIFADEISAGDGDSEPARARARARRAPPSPPPSRRAAYVKAGAAWAAAALFIVLLVIVFRPKTERVETPVAAPIDAGEGTETPKPGAAAPDDLDEAFERSLRGDAPIDADVALSAEERAAFEELRAIVRDYHSGILRPNLAVDRLEEFGRRHRDPQYASRVGTILAQVRKDLDAAGRKQVEQAIGVEIAALMRDKKLRQAWERLDALRAAHPEASADILRAEDTIEVAALAAAKTAGEASDKAASAGDFAAARRILEEGLASLPPVARPGLEAKIATAAALEEAHAAHAAALGLVEREIAAAVASLDFTRVGDALARVPEVPETSPALARARAERERVEARIRGCQDAWTRIAAGLDQAAAQRAPVAIAVEDRPDIARATYELARRDGARLVLAAARDGKDVEVAALAVATPRLVDLLGPPAELTVPLREGLGVLLLHHGRPFRAREILLDAAAMPESARSASEPLVDAAEDAFVVAALEAVPADLRKGDALGAPEAGPRPRSPAESDAVADRCRAALAAIGASERFEEAIGILTVAFLRARAESLSQGVPQVLFNGKVRSYRNGEIQLLYAFEDDAELRDFVPVLAEGCRMTRVKGAVEIRGEYRLGRGDPFIDRLEVAGQVPNGGYNLQAPNINVALWTRDDDCITPLVADSQPPPSSPTPGGGTTPAPAPRSVSGVVPNDYVVFGIGFKSDIDPYASSLSGNYLRVTGLNTIVPMPANAILSGKRGSRLLTYFDVECIWGVGVISKTKGAQNFRIAMDAKSALWAINNRPVPFTKSTESPRLIQREGLSVGSISIFTNGAIVRYSSLTVEGQLQPRWIQERLEQIAALELAALAAARQER